MEKRKYHGEVAEEEEQTIEPSMHAEIEVKCEKCGKTRKIKVPLVCEAMEGGHLECEVPEEYTMPECECGGKMKPVESHMRAYN